MSIKGRSFNLNLAARNTPYKKKCKKCGQWVWIEPTDKIKIETDPSGKPHKC